jgi:hypothetical protein
VFSLAVLGLWRGFGPFVFVPLFLGFISASLQTPVNPVAQLFFFLFIGLVIGFVIDANMRRRQMG